MISVIIPVYNAAPWLGACIDSVLAQTYPDWELILVNDGSTDSGGSICDQYAHADPRIRVIHQENRGVSAARNQGIRAACGSYICFMDSDDWIEPSLFSDLVIAMTSSQADLVTCGFTYEFEAPERSRAYTVREELIPLPSGLNQSYPSLADARILNSHCGKLFKKAIIDRHALWMEEGISTLEDGIFVLRYLTHCGSLYCLPSAAYHYRQTVTPSLQRQYSPTALEGWVLYAKAYRRLTRDFDEENTHSVYRMLWYRYRAFLIDVYAGSSMSTAQKRDGLRAFIREIHELQFFRRLPHCPEQGFFRRLLFICVKRKWTALLHALLWLRFPASN